MNYPEEVGPVGPIAPLPQERLKTPLRIALLTNFIPPYRIPVFQEIAGRVASFRVLVSTLMEANRHWAVDFGQLEVVVQRNLTLRRTWRHPSGFEETIYLHFPWDTLWQLLRYRPDVVVSGEFGFRTLNALIYKLLSRSNLVIWATISESSEAKRDKIRLFLRALMLRLADAVITNYSGIVAEPIFLKQNLGKGGAVYAGWKTSLSDSAPKLLCFVDADGAVPAPEVARLIEELLVDHHHRWDALFGSRVRMLGATLERRATRHYVGRVFATFVAVLTGIGIYDSQCG